MICGNVFSAEFFDFSLCYIVGGYVVYKSEKASLAISKGMYLLKRNGNLKVVKENYKKEG